MPQNTVWVTVRQKFYHLASAAVITPASCRSSPRWFISLVVSVLRRTTVAGRPSPLSVRLRGCLVVALTRWVPWASVSSRRSCSISQQPRWRRWWPWLRVVSNCPPALRLALQGHITMHFTSMRVCVAISKYFTFQQFVLFICTFFKFLLHFYLCFWFICLTLNLIMKM